MLSSFLVSLLSRIIPRCLTWSVLVSSLPKKSIGFIPVRILLCVKRTISVLSGLPRGHDLCTTSQFFLEQLELPHTLCWDSFLLLRQRCRLQTLVQNILLNSTPVIGHRLLVSTSADSTPPWGNPLVKWTSMLIFWSWLLLS